MPAGYNAQHKSLFLGIKTNCKFYFEMKCAPEQGEVVTTAPEPDRSHDHIFEWKDIMLAIALAEDTFNMLELGGGW